MTYCTVAQARAAGATGTDAEVTAAITVAVGLIDAYTGNVWEARPMGVVSHVEADGTVLLPYTVQEVDEVTPVGGTTPIPATGYLVLSSTVIGQVDAVVLGGAGWADPLVVGAEPWAGGWWGYLQSAAATGQVLVVGTFGTTPTPPQVTDAAAALAAWRTSGGAFVGTGGVDADDEGNAMTISVPTVTTEEAAVRTRTTGLPAADALLEPLVRARVLIGG